MNCVQKCFPAKDLILRSNINYWYVSPGIEIISIFSSGLFAINAVLHLQGSQGRPSCKANPMKTTAKHKNHLTTWQQKIKY
jgi:hypothetical protein